MWRTVCRNPNYGVNEFGEVCSFRQNKVLSPKRNHDGYLRIQLWEKGRCEFVAIHRLVAEAFIPNPEGKPFVNHIDSNKQNNLVDNLEWCTQKENINHAWENGLSHRPKNTAGMRVAQFTKKGQFIREFPSQMEVERTLGINHVNVSYAIRHRGTAGGYRWGVVE